MSQNCRGKILFSRFFFFFFRLIRQILLIEISRSLEMPFIAIYFADSSLISRGAKRETRGPDPPLITFLAPWQRDSSGVCRWQRRRCRTIIHAKTQRSCFATDYSLLRCASFRFLSLPRRIHSIKMRENSSFRLSKISIEISFLETCLLGIFKTQTLFLWWLCQVSLTGMEKFGEGEKVAVKSSPYIYIHIYTLLSETSRNRKFRLKSFPRICSFKSNKDVSFLR